MEMGLCNRLSSNGVGSDQQKGALKATGSIVCLFVGPSSMGDDL